MKSWHDRPTHLRRLGCSALLIALLSLSASSGLAQQPDADSYAVVPPSAALRVPAAGAEPIWQDTDGQPLPLRTDAEVGEFLRSARVVSSKKTGIGKFSVRKMRLEQGGIAVHAACRTFVKERQQQRIDGRTVYYFRDHFIHEPAAYALSELLGLDMVPPAVPRRVRNEPASLQIWVEGSMPAVERQERGLQPPAPQRYMLQLDQMRVFDNLINNIDRNMGNILIDSQWRIWLIDHSRSFIRDRRLPDPDGVVRIERGFWERLRSLSDDELEAAIQPYLARPERWALLERRRLLVELLEEKIALLGEARVLFSRDRLQARAR